MPSASALGAESGTQARATSGNRLSLASAATPSSCSTPLRPTGATIPNSAKMSADDVDHRGLLANKQMTGTVQHQAALLLWRLGRDEPHIRPGDRFTDRLGVSGIVLMALHPTYGFT